MSQIRGMIRDKRLLEKNSNERNCCDKAFNLR